MSKIRVIVHGAVGKMGQAVLAAVARDPDTEPVAGVDRAASGDAIVMEGGLRVPLATELDRLPEGLRPDVLIDFSVADACLPAVRWAVRNGVAFVVGTTGLPPEGIEEMRRLTERHGVGGMVASNFALGAVVMMYLARKAAPFFEYAEIIETHHETKVDAPSGTALATARMMVEAKGGAFQRNVPQKETLSGTRAGAAEGVTIHSVRLPGAMAHQEVVFGAPGQTLSIRHDTINRDCYGPGILLAVKHVKKHGGFVQGLDQLLGLGG